MTIPDELFDARIGKLHSRFLDKSDEYQGFGHVACRPRTERLWYAMHPPCRGRTDCDLLAQEKMFHWFWSDAITRVVIITTHSGIIGTPQYIAFNGGASLGRYACSDDKWADDIGSDPEEEFIKLSRAAICHFSDYHAPHLRVDEKGEFDIVRNPWLDCLYALCPGPKEKILLPSATWEKNAPELQLEAGEYYEVVGLMDVFYVSACCLEMLKHEPDSFESLNIMQYFPETEINDTQQNDLWFYDPDEFRQEEYRHEKKTKPPRRTSTSWEFQPGEAIYKGTRFDVSGKSWELLKALANSDKPVSESDLIDAAWEHDSEKDSKTLQNALSSLRCTLRKKLPLSPDVDPIPIVDTCKNRAWKLADTLR